MKRSAAVIYVVRALAHLASDGSDRQITGAFVDETLGIPRNYFIKTGGKLSRAGLLHSRRGMCGGYRLTRPADRITLLEIIEAADGPVQAEAPAVRPGDPLERQLGAICDHVAASVRKQLAERHDASTPKWRDKIAAAAEAGRYSSQQAAPAARSARNLPRSQLPALARPQAAPAWRIAARWQNDGTVSCGAVRLHVTNVPAAWPIRRTRAALPALPVGQANLRVCHVHDLGKKQQRAL